MDNGQTFDYESEEAIDDDKYLDEKGFAEFWTVCSKNDAQIVLPGSIE